MLCVLSRGMPRSGGDRTRPANNDVFFKSQQQQQQQLKINNKTKTRKADARGPGDPGRVAQSPHGELPAAKAWKAPTRLSHRQALDRHDILRPQLRLLLLLLRLSRLCLPCPLRPPLHPHKGEGEHSPGLALRAPGPLALVSARAADGPLATEGRIVATLWGTSPLDAALQLASGPARTAVSKTLSRSRRPMLRQTGGSISNVPCRRHQRRDYRRRHRHHRRRRHRHSGCRRCTRTPGERERKRRRRRRRRRRRS